MKIVVEAALRAVNVLGWRVIIDGVGLFALLRRVRRAIEWVVERHRFPYKCAVRRPMAVSVFGVQMSGVEFLCQLGLATDGQNGARCLSNHAMC
jgi:hypothetical protein